MIKNFLNWTKDKLISNPELRDSNSRLYFNYLIDSGYDTSKSIKDFLKDMEQNEIPYLDTIGRCSRRVQEENPELRGKLWSKRKIKELEVKEEILSINNR